MIIPARQGFLLLAPPTLDAPLAGDGILEPLEIRAPDQKMGRRAPRFLGPIPKSPGPMRTPRPNRCSREIGRIDVPPASCPIRLGSGRHSRIRRCSGAYRRRFSRALTVCGLLFPSLSAMERRGILILWRIDQGSVMRMRLGWARAINVFDARRHPPILTLSLSKGEEFVLLMASILSLSHVARPALA